MTTKRIGDFLVEKKLITPGQIEQILEHGSREGLRFGEAAIELGFLTEADLVRVFGKNSRADFFHVDARYFPRKTKELLSVDSILQYGILPLGTKTEFGIFNQGKTLNIGLLDPSRAEANHVAEKLLASGEFKRVRVFLILPEQFLEVLASVYGINEKEIAKRSSGLLEPVLLMFLDGRG